jgi:hypothetical protein
MVGLYPFGTFFMPGTGYVALPFDTLVPQIGFWADCFLIGFAK